MNINQHLLSEALSKVAAMRKQAFVGAGDPNMTGAPPQGAPPMDPSMMGGAMGAPPMDPAMAGAAPPADPAAGGVDLISALQPMIQQAVQQAMAASGGGGGAGGAKPKIDVGTEMHQIKMLLARIADGMGISIPATQLMSSPTDPAAAAAPPAAAPAQDAGGGLGRIEPMKAAQEEWEAGEAVQLQGDMFTASQPSFSSTADKARAILLRGRT